MADDPALLAGDGDAGTLPPAPLAMGRYVPAVAHGGVVRTAGMTPRRDGKLLVRGRVGQDLDVDTARRAAGVAAANALAAASDAVGGLERITRLLTVTVYIAASRRFSRLSAVADGASEELSVLLGDDERAIAARAAIGVAVLPDDAPVEVQLVAAYDIERQGGDG